MVEGTAKTVDAAQRYIIERPRLTRLLDSTDARIIVLLAAAGYGKTTLARQWLTGHRATWYSGPQGTRDVASVAAGLARAAAKICPAADTRVLTQIRAASSPDDAVERFAETLAADVGSWPNDAWLAIDDYQLVANFPAADRFVELLVELTPIRLLLTSRERPRWLSTRRALYGEVFELRTPQLALTENEARRVLRDLAADDIERVIAAARGWPAVTRLAAITRTPNLEASGLPAELYEYFAEELYAAAPTFVREGLLALGVLPTLTPVLSRALLGPRDAEVREEGIALGFLSPGAAGALELHPLLRAFLQAKLRQAPEARLIAERAAQAGMTAALWDEAFAIIRQFELDDLLPSLFDQALDELLRANYVATLKTWVEHATARRCDFPLLDLADADLCRRRGDGTRAEAHALQAARRLETYDVDRASHAYAIAGASAQRDMRLEDARAHYQRAAALATDRTGAQTACWGQFVVAAQLENTGAPGLLERYEQLSDKAPSDVLRAGAGGLMLVMQDGSVDAAIEKYSRLLPLVDRANDAFVTTHFVYRLGYMHVVAARYEEGERLAMQAAADAEAAGLEFVRPPTAAVRVAAAIGLRRLKRAALQIANLADDARSIGDQYEIANANALGVRLGLTEGKPDRLPEALRGWRTIGDPALRYESAALLALAHAVSANHEMAHALASEVIESTRYTQPMTLAHVTLAIDSLIRRADADEDLSALERVLNARRDWDSLVLGYRCHPDLLRQLYARGGLDKLRLEAVVRQARDLRLAAAIGWLLPKPSRTNSPLTPREREVLDLLAQGMTNKEIAARLVIEEATVKVHVRHILEKVGARTRTQAVAMLHDDA